MKNETITGGFQKLKADLAGMTLKEKAEHIWTYYRSWVIVAVAVLMLISIVCSSFINLSTKTACAGLGINVSLTVGAEDAVRTQLEDALITGNGREQVSFHLNYTDPDSTENNYYLSQNIGALVATKDLDFLLLDEEALNLVIPLDIFMNLQEFFTPEELEELSLVGVRMTEGGEDMPYLLDITDWPVVKKNANSDKKYFFAVVGNTPRPEAVKTALNLLKNYGLRGN